jgi:hypothetical protein
MHRSLHVLNWMRHRTRKLKQTNLIDWQNRDSSVDDRLQIIERTLDEIIWRDFLISDDKIPSWIFFSQYEKRKVDAIIWSDTHEKFMNLLCSLAVELGFGQKFKPVPRVDVRPNWTDQSSQPDPRIDVRRILSSLSETSYI